MTRWKTPLFGNLLLWALKLGKWTIRWRMSGMDKVEACLRAGRPIVFAGWHGHNYLTLLAYHVHLRKRMRAAIFVPDSPNGRVMAHFGEKARLDVIRVGMEMGPIQWARATLAVIRQLRTGAVCALVSPDGPEGPACVAKPGIGVIGRRAEAVIIPASAGPGRDSNCAAAGTSIGCRFLFRRRSSISAIRSTPALWTDRGRRRRSCGGGWKRP